MTCEPPWLAAHGLGAVGLTRLGVLSTGRVVYLSGTVVSADEKTRAGEISRSVRGVERVVNTLDFHTE